MLVTNFIDVMKTKAIAFATFTFSRIVSRGIGSQVHGDEDDHDEIEELVTNEVATDLLWKYLDTNIKEDETGLSFTNRTKRGSLGKFPSGSAQCVVQDNSTKVGDICVDDMQECSELAKRGECLWHYMACKKSCYGCFVPNGEFTIGIEQEIPYPIKGENHEFTTANIKSIADVINQTQHYMSSIVMNEEQYMNVRRSCQNYDEYCSAYASIGNCDADFENGIHFIFMRTYCAPACQACDEYQLLQPCTVNYDHSIMEEGDLNRMFLRIVRDHKAIIYSRPDGLIPDKDKQAPWIIALPDFLSSEECDRLIQLGKEAGYSRSGLQAEDDEEEYRTSVNAWCFDECRKDPIADRVIQRISHTLNIPTEYSESLQLLKYIPGQYYKEHHDFIDEELDKLMGPRLVTFFLYLNNVEEGGATKMVDIHYDGFDNDETPTKPLEIYPQKGMALIWPNLDDDDFSEKEEGTWHEALPVEKGIKYGANAWFHLRRFESRCNTADFRKWKQKYNVNFKENDV